MSRCHAALSACIFWLVLLLPFIVAAGPDSHIKLKGGFHKVPKPLAPGKGDEKKGGNRNAPIEVVKPTTSSTSVVAAAPQATENTVVGGTTVVIEIAGATDSTEAHLLISSFVAGLGSPTSATTPTAPETIVLTEPSTEATPAAAAPSETPPEEASSLAPPASAVDTPSPTSGTAITSAVAASEPGLSGAGTASSVVEGSPSLPGSSSLAASKSVSVQAPGQLASDVQPSDATPIAQILLATSGPNYQLPGRTLSVFPVGLGVFVGISLLGLGMVGFVTWERRKYRMEFRARKAAAMESATNYGSMSERRT